MAVPGSSNARTSLIVQLSPTKSAKLSFTVQIILTLFWLAWSVMLLVTTDGTNYLYYVFFALALVFFTYVVLQNTSIFGVQSYIEVTQQYIVQKYGVFRTKHIIAIPDIAAVHISPYALRITLKDNTKVYLDLKQVRKKRDLDKIKNKIKDMAALNGFALSESTANRP